MKECPECGAQYADSSVVCSNDGAALRETSDPMIGRTLGSYVLTRCLGKGGMGAVYEGEHPSIKSKVAVKFLHRQYASDPAIVERFFNEARAVNLIGHDNIVKVSDFATSPDGSPYFIMEFLDGHPLSALLPGPRPLEELGPIFLQVADGLSAAHDQGIIHRDLKPDNVFLVSRNRRANVVKIVDFGIAKLQNGASTGKTQTGVVMGTAHYMSPEQAAGEVGRISPASDVYSLGVIMFQLVCGRLPFEGASFGEVLIGHMMKPPPAPTSLVPTLPVEFEQIIVKCLAKQPSERFTSMGDLYEALGAALDAHGLPRDPPVAKASSHPSHPGLGLPRPPSRPPPGTEVPSAARAPSRPPPGTELMSGARRPSSPSLASDDRPGATKMASSPGVASRPPPRAPSSPGRAKVEDERTGATVAMASGRQGSLPPKAAPKSKAPLVGALVGLVVVVGAGGAFLAMHRAPPDEVTPTPVAAQAPQLAPDTTVAAAPATVHVVLASDPKMVKVTIIQDGVTKSVTTPATVELVRGHPATALLEADGYATQKDFKLDTSVDNGHYHIVLTALPRRPAPAVHAEHEEKHEDKPKKTNVGDGIMDPFAQ